MSIADQFELENTRRKLAQLESFHRETRDRPMASEHVRELTLRSIRKRINQLKEEIMRFETAGARP